MTKSCKHKTFQTLRAKYPEFTYFGYLTYLQDSNIIIKFHFKAGDDYSFYSNWEVNLGDNIESQVFYIDAKETLINLGMIELMSYWKAFCSPRITTTFFKLTPEQKAWWRKLFRYGMAEFFHTNNIPQQSGNFLHFRANKYAEYFSDNVRSTDQKPDHNKVLVPVGGGKDSVLTLRMIQKAGKTPVPFIINPRKATDDVIKAAGFKPEQCITIKREIDPLLLKLNKKGFLNGHTPFSALVAFAALFAAQLTKITEIALSNESSANEATVPGTKINHQYSKSFEFEKDFRDYVFRFIDKGINYYSFLRPLNELQIGKRFARYTKFHEVFKSCNVGSKTDTWCRKCSKCLFTYIMLAPFLPDAKMQQIFGNNLLEDAGLLSELEALCGMQDEKPFECVGTLDDVNIALVALIKQIEANKKSLPVLLVHYKNSSMFAAYRNKSMSKYLNQFDEQHFVPDQYLRLFKK